MARIGSQAIGGYYALPDEVVGPIASLIDVSAVAMPQNLVVAIDPCAADGAALLGLLHQWFGELHDRHSERGPMLSVYVAELEQERAQALRGAVNRQISWQAEQNALHCDAFRVEWKTAPGRTGSSLLYLNPPYDQDAAHRRLEQRFLERFTGALMPGRGVLLFVLPHDALAASADFLATHYEEITCFRFPTAIFAWYRQVVLVARRRTSPLETPDPRLCSQIERWSQDSDSIDGLPDKPRPVIALRAGGTPGLQRWKAAPLDLLSVRQALRPGTYSDGRGMKAYGLDGDMDGLMGGRPFPVAMPPRPGHIAQALSAGIINGAILEPDTVELPQVLAKGVFERELTTVDQRTNKQGEITSVVQVQQPILRLCVLDIAAGHYHDIAPGSVPSNTTDISKMNAADLLSCYRGSLVNVIAQQCPALHPLGDPSAALPMPALARRPYRAQYEAIYATLKLLGHGENPFVIGEVGTGKSTIALAAVAALASEHLEEVRQKLTELGLPSKLRPVRRVLIVCPPHLLQSWQDQITAVLPGAGVIVIDSTLDVHAEPPCADPTLPGAGLTLYILSRETAKLGHGIGAGVDAKRRCPRCGGLNSATDAELVRTRARCTHHLRQPANAAATVSHTLAQLLITALPEETRVNGAVEPGLQALGRKIQQARAELAPESRKAEAAAAWALRTRSDAPLATTILGQLLRSWIQHIRDGWAGDTKGERLADQVTILAWLFFSSIHVDRDALLAKTLVFLYGMTASDTYDYGRGSTVRKQLRELVLLLTPGEARQQTIEAMQNYGLDVPKYAHLGDPWKAITSAIARLARETQQAHDLAQGRLLEQDAQKLWEQIPYGEPQVRVTLGGALTWDDRAAGGAAAKHALELIAGRARYTSEPCEEPQFQAIPEPRRCSVARYITRKARNRFDFLIIDEGHEFAGDGSAQEIAVHRLSEMGLPTLMLTGSLMNGYASGLFRNLWALSRRFRQEFGRDEQRAFVTRYGYRKVLREPKDEESRKQLAYGAVTDRRQLDALTTMRTIGEAPGVLPVLLLQHLLPIAVTIRKSDLDDAIPPCAPPEVVPICLDPHNPNDVQLQKQADTLFRATLDRIKADRFSALSGKLFGALGQLPSFYDRATQDAGNIVLPGGTRGWEVRYPENSGGELVAAADLLDASVLLPKERWLCEKLRDELAEGRNVLVFIAHSGKTGLAPRLARLIAQHTGETPIILDSGKVPTARREAWINTQVVQPGRRIMIVNPTTVQTGLNNLVWFSTAIWFENPACNAIVFRQANGRLDRIGQTRAVRIFVPIYASTPQEIAQELLARKIMASEQVDGMDVAASLDAAGAGGERDALDTLEMGRAIYAMLVSSRA